MSIEELVKMSVGELVGAYVARRLSPVEVLKTTLAHAETVNPLINALFCIRPEEAMTAARASEARWKALAPLGLLDGVPLTVKDSIAIVGWPNTHGVRANRNLPPSSYDSPPTLALRESGAPIFAKTTMPDCGLLASGVSSMHGVARNPWGPRLEHGRILFGRRSGGRGRRRASDGRDRHRGLGAPARRSLRPGLSEADARPRAASAARHDADGRPDGTQRRGYCPIADGAHAAGRARHLELSGQCDAIS